MTGGRRKARARYKAFNKFKNRLGRNLNKEERIIFWLAFNMGWKSGKKRQLQISNRDISNNINLHNLLGSLVGGEAYIKIANEALKDIDRIFNKDKIIFNKEKGYWSLK